MSVRCKMRSYTPSPAAPLPSRIAPFRRSKIQYKHLIFEDFRFLSGGP